MERKTYKNTNLKSKITKPKKPSKQDSAKSPKTTNKSEVSIPTKIDNIKPRTAPIIETETTAISENEYESDFQDEEPEIQKSNEEIKTDKFEEKYRKLDFDSNSSNKLLKKYRDLKNIIKFEYSVPFELIDRLPIENYDLLINRLTNKNNIGIQSNEDVIDEETQTQNINMEEMWTQQPSIFLNSGDCSIKNTGVKENDNKLERFVEKAGKLILAVLSEEKRHFVGNKKQLKCFDESYSIKTPHQLKNRICSYVQFANSDPNILYTVHNPNYICIWNIKDPQIPQKILNCETEIASLTSPLDSANEIYAGNIDGSILVWDLKCTPTHSAVQVYSIYIQNISPCYNTCYEHNGHSSPVVAVSCVPLTNEMQFNYQLVSIEKYSKLNIWSVYKSDDESIANFPGAKLKLFLNFSVSLGPNIILFSLACHPEDNHYYLGTNIGPIRLQKQRKSGVFENYKNNEISTNIFCVEFSAVLKDYFIAGTTTNEILLYKINRKHPLCIFECLHSQPILIKWIQSCPLMFFCVCEDSEIYFFNFLESTTAPILYEKFDSKKVISADMNNYNEIGINKFYLSITFNDGKTKIFKFSQETTKFSKYFDYDVTLEKLQDNLLFQNTIFA